MGASESTPPVGTLYLAHGWGEPTQSIGLRIQGKLESLGVDIINPFQREEQGFYDEFAAKGLPYPPEVCEQIVNGDLDKIDQSDGIIAVPGEKSIGTFMEIFYASYLYEKPIWTLWLHGKRSGGEGDRHPWLDHLTKLYVGADKEQVVIDDIVAYFTKGVGRFVKGSERA